MADPNKPVLDLAAILGVFRRFSHFEDQLNPHEPLGYEQKVKPRLQACFEAREPIPLLLPAAPFKNACADKVLDTKWPDFGEELGLSRLDHLCNDLARVYPYGAQITIVSDGPVYNDLLYIPPSDFYDYGVALRKIATDKGFSRIRFRRLADVLGIANGDVISKEDYLSLVERCRYEMELKYLPEDFEVKKMIKDDRDTMLTYEGYVKLANDDLRWGPDLDVDIKNNPEKYAAESKRVAEKMTERLLAYERCLAAVFPHHIRLSIHRSTGKAKISIPLIPQPKGFGPQPWHCCVIVTVDGQYLTGHSKDYRGNDKYEIIKKNGRAHFVREKHSDFEWPEPVFIRHEYGGKVVIENTGSDDLQLTEELKVKLANLGIRFGQLEIRGFRLE
ncbi:hypothetical protein NLG97_g5215 [Lecanicillium saksenae]|uniref:Uncharacterized protein n=1 Tax=Lecanicillium saksenae TaxID=468837 RepID=A0ACC1QWA3_9HYPO|nr:hypothetical protein NLG97_g5215 [Lecanicillium saksenae]